MADDAFATGHCLCGAVQFKIKAEPMMTGQCHCKDCQRASGTGHMSLASPRPSESRSAWLGLSVVTQLSQASPCISVSLFC